MSRKATRILDSRQIGRKVNRIAFQVHEDNYGEKSIILAGIATNGYLLAERIAAALKKLSHLEVMLIKVTFDKDNPIGSQVELPMEDPALRNKVVVLVDDVLNSGRTLIYGTRRFLRQPIKKLRTVVLVDRDHKRFPIGADFVGLSLATTMQEHVKVELGKKEKENGVFLV